MNQCKRCGAITVCVDCYPDSEPAKALARGETISAATPTELTELRADAERILASAQAWCDESDEDDDREHWEREIRVCRAFLDAPPPLAWSDAKPTVPGWYWWRAPYSQPEMILLFRTTDSSPLVMDRRNGTYMTPDVGQFAGPIPPPALEAKETPHAAN